MSKTPHDSDVAFIQALAELLNQNDLAELSVKREYGEHDSLNVKVSKYAAAAAAPGTKARVRREVPGPERIDQKQWEEVVATAMKQVKVTSLGEIQPAEDFVDAGDDEAWAMWNQSQDAALQ